MDDNSRKALRNILIFTTVKFGTLYLIQRALKSALKP